MSLWFALSQGSLDDCKLHRGEHNTLGTMKRMVCRIAVQYAC